MDERSVEKWWNEICVRGKQDHHNLCPTHYGTEVTCPATHIQTPSTHSEAQAGTMVYSIDCLSRNAT